MTILEHSDVPTQSAEICELEHLERMAQALWGAEPDCSPDDRFTLMTRLSSVCAELDRARVRLDADPDSVVDPAVLDHNRRELDAMSAEWMSSTSTSGEHT